VSEGLDAVSSLFTVTAAATSARLDAARHGAVSFTVTNATAAALRGRVRIVPLNPAASTWLSISGDAERDFGPNASQQFTVLVVVPADAPAGSYTFRLDAVGVANPDEQFTQGPTVSFDVPAPAPVPAKPFPWLLVVGGAVVVILVAGVAAFLLLRNVSVPDVVGQPIAQAQSTLSAASLHVEGTSEATASTTPALVIQQQPGAGTPAPRNSGVDLVVAIPIPTDTPTSTPTTVPTVTPTLVPTATPVPPPLIASAVVSSTTLAAGGTGAASVNCPAGTTGLGGGIDLDNVLTMKVTASGPTFGNGTRLASQPDGSGPAPSGWRGSAISTDSSTHPIKVAAICGAGTSRTSLVSSGTANANTFASIRLTCPAGTVAVGGGVDAMLATMVVTASAPTFAANNNRLIFQPDGNAAAPNGWQASVLNPTATAQAFKAAVVCMPLPSAAAVVSSGSATAKGGFQAVRVTCPAGRVATGGGIDLQNVLTMAVSSSGPTFAANNDRLISQPNGTAPPPVGWQASTVNNDPAVQPFKVAAICAAPS
jgi:hypothetical protein